MAELVKKLEVKDLTVSFRTTQGMVRAVRGVTFDLYEGETLAIVGESGSGKSVSSRTIMGILAGNGVIDKGSIVYEGEDLTQVDEEHFHEIRGNRIGMIFQDPMSSLNPIMRIGKQITEGMILNGKRLENRYKHLINDERVRYNRLKRDRKGLKRALKANIKAAKKGLSEELPKLYEEVTNLNHEIFGLNREISSNTSTIKNKNTKLSKEELAVQKERMIAEIVEYDVKIKNAQAQIDSLIAESQVDIDNYIKGLYEQYELRMKDINSQMPQARAELKTKKAEAKIIVNNELLAEKERIAVEIEKVKAEEQQELPNIQAKAATIQDEIEKLQADLVQKNEEYKAVIAELEPNIVKVKKREHRMELRTARAEIKAKRIERSNVLNTYRDKVADLNEEFARFKKVTKKEAHERAIQVMNEVGIDEPEKRITQFPFQFSGGMRQRIVIAIALTASPDILICDEPTTALDVTIQAQILELINDLKKERSLSVIFITHDLGVVANMADRIGVMYAGKIVELGTAEDVFYDPRHPYTWALLSSMPDLDSKERLTAIAGTPPNMLFPPIGDAFAERNSYAMKIDFERQPPMFKVSESHSAASWLLHPNAPKVEMPKIISKRIERMTSNSEKEAA